MGRSLPDWNAGIHVAFVSLAVVHSAYSRPAPAVQPTLVALALWTLLA